jgi:hypothetical protein
MLVLAVLARLALAALLVAGAHVALLLVSLRRR